MIHNLTLLRRIFEVIASFKSKMDFHLTRQNIIWFMILRLFIITACLSGQQPIHLVRSTKTDTTKHDNAMYDQITGESQIIGSIEDNERQRLIPS